MSVRTIVPTLGLIAAVGSASAVEVGSVTIGGFVDSIFEIVSNKGNPPDTADTDPNIEWSAMAELQVGATITDGVALQVDVELYGDDQSGVAGNYDVTHVEQAYVAWGINDKVTLMMGKWEGLIGYEAWDAPGLQRINTSPIFDVNGILPTGLDVNVAVNEMFTLDFYLANGVYVDDQVNTDSFGIGVSLTYAAETFMIDLDIASDLEGAGTAADPEGILGINISGEYTGMENLTIFGDLAHRDFGGDDNDGFGIMLGGKYQFTPKAAGSLMVTFLDDNDDGPGDAIWGEEMEVALALLTTPTDSENFGVNFELEFVTPEADGLEDEVGVYVEFLGIIP